MKRQFCDKCNIKPNCRKPCKIVMAELRSKGVYDYVIDEATGRETTALKPKEREIELQFVADTEMDRIRLDE